MMQIIKQNQQQTTNWSGGTTTPLFIFPVDADYAKRDFLFRISTATVETATSSFTDLKGYQRIIMLLQGKLSITHNNEVTHHLQPLIPHLFDGAWKTTAVGRVTDFNVMFKPEVKAHVDVVLLSAKQSTQIPESTDFIYLYVAKGEITMQQNQQTNNLHEKDFVVLDGELLHLDATANSIIIKVTIQF
jgi:environmental stress-induced protein Ves